MKGTDGSETTGHIIAAGQRLSHSVIWDIQRQYFLRNGLKAWQEEVVPHYISSNPYVARSYGRVVLGYLRDCAAAGALNPEQPIYIVELGAGSGRLAYHFLTRFFPLLKRSPLAHLNVKYVMTDFVPEILAFWQEHERFQPWIEAGMLDFALFDAVDLRPITLTNAQTTLTPDEVVNPLILIANYFFDSIPQDCFAIVNGRLCENLLTIHSAKPDIDPADAEIWKQLKLTYKALPLRRPYYEVETYNLILEDYERIMPDTVLLFPNRALDCLRFWQPYGKGRNLMLTADWGYTQPESLIGQENPMPNMHGSFSLRVNYDAFKQFVLLEGGLALHPPHYQDSLQVGAYLLGERPQNALETRLAFSEAVSAGGPDDYYSIKEALDGRNDDLSLAQMLSCLRWSSWDAVMFEDFYPALLARIVNVSPAWYKDVYDAAAKVWQGYFPLKGGAFSEGVFIDEDELHQKIVRLLRVMGFEDKVDDFFAQI